jgi:hypothetical protein
MWLFCDKCCEPAYDADMKDCEECGDYFCDTCDHQIQSILSLRVNGFEMDFCKIGCIKEYLKDILNVD